MSYQPEAPILAQWIIRVESWYGILCFLKFNLILFQTFQKIKFVSQKKLWKTKYSISGIISGRHFEKSILHPSSNTANYYTPPPHVIPIRLLHPWKIWLVAFQIYHICKIKHIFSKYMIIQIMILPFRYFYLLTP